MSTYFKRYLLGILVLLGLWSCGSDTDYAKPIPADAVAVVSVDLATLYRQSGISDSKHKELLDQFKQGVLPAEFRKFFDDPEELGLKLSKPVYLFVTKDQSIGLIAKVSSADKVEQGFEELKGYGLTIKSEGDIRYADVDKLASIAFDDETLLLLASKTKETASLVRQLMTQSKEESAISQKYFDQSLSQSGAIKAVLNVDGITSLMELIPDYKQFITSTESLKKYRNLYYLFGLEFEDGAVALRQSYYTEDEQTKELLKRGAEVYKPYQGKFNKNIPESPLFFAGFGLDGKKLANTIFEDGSLQKMFGDKLPAETVDKVKTILQGIDGDVTVVASDDIAFNAYVETKTAQPVALLAKLLEEQAQAEQAETIPAVDSTSSTDADTYSIGDASVYRTSSLEHLCGAEYLYKTGALDIYFGYKDGRTYISTKEDTSLKTPEPNIEQSAIYKAIRSEDFTFFMDFKPLVNFVKPLLAFSEGYSGLAESLSKLDYISVTGDASKNTSEIRLVLTDDSENSLKQIVDALVQLK